MISLVLSAQCVIRLYRVTRERQRKIIICLAYATYAIRHHSSISNTENFVSNFRFYKHEVDLFVFAMKSKNFVLLLRFNWIKAHANTEYFVCHVVQMRFPNKPL